MLLLPFLLFSLSLLLSLLLRCYVAFAYEEHDVSYGSKVDDIDKDNDDNDGDIDHDCGVGIVLLNKYKKKKKRTRRRRRRRKEKLPASSMFEVRSQAPLSAL